MIFPTPIERVQLAEGYKSASYSSMTDHQRGDYELAMRGLLEPLYGSQDAALDKVRRGNDREAEAVVHIATGRQVGTLVYKTTPQTERYWNLHNGDDVLIADALEVKTLALFDDETDGGQGIGSWLVSRAEHVASEVGAKGIVLTVLHGDLEQYFGRRHGFSGALLMPETRHGETPGTVMYKSLEM